MPDIFDVSIEGKECGTHNPKNSFEFPITFTSNVPQLPSVVGNEIHYVVRRARRLLLSPLWPSVVHVEKRGRV